TNSIEHESLYFMYTFNGANSPKSISFHFQDGVLRNYVDAWGIFIVGNEDVKVTREEAIEIARSDAIESSTNPLNFTSARTVTANLHMVVREKLTLYPFWFVELPLDYPNSTVNGWQEGIWADTGKIAYGHPTGMLGSMPDPNSISPSPSNEPIVQPSNLQLNNSASDNSPLIIVVIIILVISIISIATFRMKRGTK
ncbi:MAG TPA: hypothetical protein VLH35_05070, partial [Candidatus Acidoferrales bacterium]|nr:hypothetical protein [Candidatus Acidoferrales bacterium]